MKTNPIFLILFLACQVLYAQTTTGIAVQGIARDANKAAMVGRTLTFTFTLSDGSSTPAYKETQEITTDAFGVFSHIIGTGTASTSSPFSDVSFGKVQLSLKVEAGGVVLLDGPFQYAPYAKNADNGVPVGGIIMWSGTSAPAGWALCDGQVVNGITTPDLRGRFIVSIGTSSASPTNYALNATGGEEKHKLSVNEMPGHDHGTTITTSSNGSHRHDFWTGIGNGSLAVSGAPQIGFGAFTGTYDDSTTPQVDGYWASRGTDYINDAGSHTHTATINSEGGDQGHENRPPFYALAYIIRVR